MTNCFVKHTQAHIPQSSMRTSLSEPREQQGCRWRKTMALHQPVRSTGWGVSHQSNSQLPAPPQCLLFPCSFLTRRFILDLFFGFFSIRNHRLVMCGSYKLGESIYCELTIVLYSVYLCTYCYPQ